MPDDKQGRQYKALSEGLTLALLFPSAIVGGFIIGRWLDGKFTTGPWLTIACTVMGIAAAFVYLFRSFRSNDRTE